LLGSRALVLGSCTLALDEFNAPEPDIAVAAPSAADDLRRPIAPAEVHALVEVSHTSFRKDAGPKRDLYARFGIADYLIADVEERRLIRFSSPFDGRYAGSQTLSSGETSSLTGFPEIVLDVDPFLLPQR
jgi:Uma2 family endonuclease